MNVKNTQVTNAFHKILKLRTSQRELEVEDFGEDFSIIIDALPQLDSHDVILITYEMMQMLTNQNVRNEIMQLIPQALIRNIVDSNLLTIEDFTSVMVQLSKHFTMIASNWIYEVYSDGYLLFATRQDYPIAEIGKALVTSSFEDIEYFLSILKTLYEPEDSFYEKREKIQDIIQTIEAILL